MHPQTDNELLDAFRSKKDETAFAELVHRYSNLVYMTCRRVLGNPHDAEDATQAVFVALSLKAHK